MIENELNKTNAIIENPNNSKNINCENDPKMESVDVDVDLNLNLNFDVLNKDK